MRTQEADALGSHLAGLVQAGHAERAYALLAPTLAERTPFRLLDRIGDAVGAPDSAQVNAFLQRVAGERTEGGWVVIASALRRQYPRDPADALAFCREFTITADVWYATDILGERVPGPALVTDLKRALRLLAPWRQDSNRWIRRTVGVAVHFWAKRAHGAPECAPQAQTLLRFLEPMFEEREMDAIKGVGWGLKTLGRYYPDLVSGWLKEQINQKRRHCRALMLRKALTYLPAKPAARIRADSCRT